MRTIFTFRCKNSSKISKFLPGSQKLKQGKNMKKFNKNHIKQMDAEEITAREEMRLQEKLKSQKKQVDYYERAKRLEEIQLLEATKERMIKMKPDKDIFLEKLLKERNAVYQEKLKEFEKMLAEERCKRLAVRKEKRKEERRQKYRLTIEKEEEEKKSEE